MRQIIQADELVGKTILRTECCMDDFYIIFTDETFAKMHTSTGYDDDSEIELSTSAPSNGVLHRMGFITDKEYKRRTDEGTVRWQQEQDTRQRRQYEELKKKFG